MQTPHRLPVVVILIVSIILSAAYIFEAHMLPQSWVSAHAQFKIESPFIYRLLLPVVLNQLLPMAWLDSLPVKFVIADAALMAAILLMPAFVQRMANTDGKANELRNLGGITQMTLIVIWLAHYCVPRIFHYYYIYDWPSVVLYQLSFLWLTQNRTKLSPWAMLFVLICSLNRETVSIAVVHAMCFHLHPRNWQDRQVAPNRRRMLLGYVLTFLGFALVRHILNVLLEPQGAQNAALMEGDQFRILVNLYRVTHEWRQTVTLLMFGCGAIIWLPLAWSTLPSVARRYVLATTPMFAILMLVGNMTELRIYNELTPLLAILLALVYQRQRYRLIQWRSIF